MAAREGENMKYIIVDAPGGEMPILFPRSFAHRYVADVFGPMKVAAAGFVAWEDGKLACGGLSTGLNIVSRPKHDTALVLRALTAEVKASRGASE
jgi:hypothetical protein